MQPPASEQSGLFALYMKAIAALLIACVAGTAAYWLGFLVTSRANELERKLG
jgi:hypothetical protein